MKVYLRILFLMTGDFLSFFGSFIIVAALYRFFGGEYYLSQYLRMWPLGLLFILINEIAKLYHGSLFYPGATFGPAEELRRIFYSVTSVYFGLLTFLFISKDSDHYSRMVFVVSWPLAVLAVVFLRWFLRGIFKRYNFGYVKAVVLGAGKTGKQTARLLNKNKYLGILPVAFLDDDLKLSDSIIEGITVRGKLKDILQVSKTLGAEYIITCLPMSVVMQKIKEHCDGFKHILIIPSDAMFSTLWVYAYDIGGMLGLEIRCNLLLKWPLLLKRITDYCLAVIITILSLPLMITCALLIKFTSHGPLVYKARRLGKNGCRYFVYKFRTMKIGTDAEFEQYLESNPEAKEEWQKTFKLKRDPRVTWIGHFLRRASLDELPQLLNVIKGDMSLIGPRPIVESEIAFYEDKYDMIASIKPGITGLWQVSGRSSLDYTERVELDCYYLMNWNIWLDFYILLKSVKEVFLCKGAY